MATPVIMPRQGQSVESCIISEWLKKVGDEVKTGEPLFSYETDKASFEAEATAEGTLLAIFFKEDDDVPCLTNVAVIGAPGEDFAQFAPGGAAASEPPEAAKEAVKEAAPEETAAAIPAAASAEHAQAVSPRARAAAEKMHINPEEAAPTGPHGRVIERDVLAYAKMARTGTGLGGRLTGADVAAASGSQEPAAEFEDKKLSNVRKVIAKSMHQSLSTMAQLTHNTSFDATAVLDLRRQLKARESKITINDIILFAVSRVLMNHPDLNAHFLDDKMRLFKHVNLGIAVDTPRGLLVPTLRNADLKTLPEISTESKRLIAAAQDGSISPDLLSGASFTVTNLGSLGVESFTPVINPPQTGILGVCCSVDRVRMKNGQVTVYPAMGLSLTYDHRAIDGAPASKFLVELRAALENIDALLIGG